MKNNLLKNISSFFKSLFRYQSPETDEILDVKYFCKTYDYEKIKNLSSKQQMFYVKEKTIQFLNNRSQLVNQKSIK